MEFKRSHRVGEQIQKEVSGLLMRGLKDPRIGFVTITGVEVTSDLSVAWVYYTVMGDDNQRRETGEGLEKATPYIRSQVARQLRMRHMPELRFKYDSSIDYGNRIESLLKDIQDERGDDQGDPEDN